MLKRTFDFLLCMAGLVILSPLLAIVAIWIKLNSEGPVFYRGVRAGKNGTRFRIFKFRTMVVNADKIGGPSTSGDDLRLTSAGKFIRKFKIDELPQLLNVIRGEMSLVGPRPEVPSEVALYTAEERKLLSVNPGITDWSSIRFRNEGEILAGSADPHLAYREKIRPEKIRLGLKYVKRHNFWIDLRIILATLFAVVGGDPEALAGTPRSVSAAVGQADQQMSPEGVRTRSA